MSTFQKIIFPTFILFFLFISTIANSQTDKKKALQLASEGISLMDKGQTDEAIEKLEQAQALDPENYVYQYEIAHAHYLTRHYKKTISILENLLTHNYVSEKAYQLLGNSYDNLGKYDKALDLYKKGLELFPNSGELYLELGVVEMHRKDYDDALLNFEKGIQVEPAYPSNYYWAAKIKCSVKPSISGVIYGEMFMNMERTGNRNAEMSGIVYQTWQKLLRQATDTTVVESLSGGVIETEKKEDFETVVLKVLGTSIDEIQSSYSATELNEIRQTFINSWYSNALHDKYPNLLFDHLFRLDLSDNFSAYNYWIFREGNYEAYNEQINTNKAAFDIMERWSADNKLKPSTAQYFTANQYDFTN